MNLKSTQFKKKKKWFVKNLHYIYMTFQKCKVSEINNSAVESVENVKLKKILEWSNYSILQSYLGDIACWVSDHYNKVNIAIKQVTHFFPGEYKSYIIFQFINCAKALCLKIMYMP